MANIFEWIGRRDEKRALLQVGDHVEKVLEVARLLKEGLEASARGERARVEEIHDRLAAAEHRADEIRRELLSSLSEGLLLPADRDDLVRLIERLDHVADEANGAMRILVLLDADLPAELHKDLLEFGELLVQITDQLGQALASLYQAPAAETLRKCTDVEETEEECDRRKAALLRHVMSMELSAARLLLLHDLIDMLETTSDRAEDTADVIRNLAVKVKR